MIASSFYFFCCLVAGILLHESYKIQNFGFGYAGPEVFPKAITGIFLVMSIILLVKSILRRENYDKELILNKRQALMFGAFIVYVLAIKYVGYLYSTPLYIAATILYLVPNRNVTEVVKAIAISIGTTALVYYVFAVELKVFLPAGIWG